MKLPFELANWRVFNWAPSIPELTLTRFAYTDTCVIGRMGELVTLENPWKDNKPSISCVPTGRWLCKRSWYNKGGYAAFELQNVPGRSLILPHIGNTAGDTRGCPLFGNKLGILNGHLATLNSKTAYEKWMASMEGIDTFWLTIEDYEDAA